jgi:hypothetical protein
MLPSASLSLKGGQHQGHVRVQVSGKIKYWDVHFSFGWPKLKTINVGLFRVRVIKHVHFGDIPLFI